MVFEIKGRIPSKKNSKIMVCRGRIPILLPSKKYQEWHKEASLQIPKNVKKKEFHQIHLTLYAPDKRKADLTNKAESIMDLLVDNGVLEDDNWFVLENIVLLFGGVDRKNPRVVLELT